MASKHKITAYISDTAVFEWVKKTAIKKGVTGSGYLESLIHEDMQKRKTEETLVIAPRFSVFDVFTPREQILALSDCLNVDYLPLSGPGDREKNYLEQLKNGINSGIHHDFYNNALGEYIKNPNAEFYTVFLKTFFDGWVAEDEGTISLRVNYKILYQSLLITQELWDKYKGLYDFFNIRYLRQTDIITSEFQRSFSRKYAGAAPIFERQKLRNDSGGFFIPVYHKPVTLEERLSDPRLIKKLGGTTDIYTGVDANYNKARFNLKNKGGFKQM